jgi:hypothetical protein
LELHSDDGVQGTVSRELKFAILHNMKTKSFLLDVTIIVLPAPEVSSAGIFE